MKKLVYLFLMMFAAASVSAQVTTSTISGSVVDENGNSLVGAAVIAIHTPSGTEYGTVVDSRGNYRIMNVRPGSPYTVQFQMLGYTTVIMEGNAVSLGDTFVLDAVMQEETLGIENIVVASTRNPIMNSQRTGASTNVNSKDLATLPTISRSINDFTRLTPQAGSGNSFGGRDGRYNNIMIDGASFNNRFGVNTTNNMPGGDAQPISLDAIQEVQVNISPFDIRESSFTGASINAVTRSGTNEIEGSAYTYFRPKSFTGDRVGDKKIDGAKDSKTNSYGLRLGGPIIKNKLFYFVNGEYEKSEYPGIKWRASENGVGDADNFISRTSKQDLAKLSQFLKDKYQYDPGKYENFGNFSSSNYKILARVDWNINRDHKFTVRYNQVISKNDQQANATSAPSGLSRASSGRYSANGFAFGNSNYGFENSVYSFTAELNSNFRSNISNKLSVAWTSSQDTRTSDSDIFPFVDIWKDGDIYTSFGYELFTYNNDVRTKSLIITDNVTVALGNHTLVAGASFERQYFKNAYMRNPLSYYRYDSLDDFMNGNKPSGFGITYSYTDDDAPGVELTFGMLSLYLQDEWRINPKFKLTAGLRLEMPFYFNDVSEATNTRIQGARTDLQNNPVDLYITDIVWAQGITTDMGVWPKQRPIVSPRIGFNWDIKGDRSLQLRGGTGLFTGLLPFVWYTNQPNGGGFIQSPEVTIAGKDLPDNFRFNPDYKQVIRDNPNLFPVDKGLVASGSAFAKVDDNFKLPQIWRTNLALDIALPYDLIFTAEAIYSKDVNAVMQQNINQKTEPNGYFNGPDNRGHWFNSAGKADQKIENSVGSMIYLTNTSKGYQASFTGQLTKKYSHNWSGMIAYTYNIAKDISANPGSTAASVWSSNVSAGSLNYPGLSYSNFSVPHRINGYVSYTVEWLRHLASTFTLYYNGSHAGRLSFVYSNDMNGDGYSSDLIFVPGEKDHIKLIDVVNKEGEVTYTADQQYSDLFNFINDNKYLRNRKGKYAERYGALQGWTNRIDFKFVQDVFTNFGTQKRYGLQVSLDILNVGNMINKNWSSFHQPIYGFQTYQNMPILTYKGMDNSGNPQYTLNADSRSTWNDKSKKTSDQTTTSTWGMMLGVRLNF